MDNIFAVYALIQAELIKSTITKKSLAEKQCSLRNSKVLLELIFDKISHYPETKNSEENMVIGRNY